MRIVVLDASPASTGDLSWDAFDALGQVTIHQQTTPEQLRPRCAEADAVLTNKVPITAADFAALPRLRYVGVLATGVNVIDLPAARQHNVVVTNVAGYSTAHVAQHVFALLLELTNGCGPLAEDVRAGGWTRSTTFAYWKRPPVELDGLCMGVVGFGDIGRRVARIAGAFGMGVRVHTRRPPANGAGVGTENGPRFGPLDELLENSDVVSLHCPLTEQTRGLIGSAQLARMKPTAYLINTARGPLIDEAALAQALQQGRIAGAGLDVLSAEPPPAHAEHTQALIQAPNCVITPHIAWASLAARRRLIAQAAANLAAFAQGSPINVVN